MCGIVGLISSRASTPDLITRLVEPLTHRGPDDRGIWIDREASIGLGQRRLAIIDLSPKGHQPMVSGAGRWVITYNGEIYNHRELRAELEAAHLAPEGGWSGHSDTETLLQAVAAWGLDGALSRAKGMFAFGLWDRSDRKLYLVRDRFGEKPLYYGWVGGDFLFGSELKALRAHPRFDNDIDRQAVDALARTGYIPAPLSIYRRIFKLQPGCKLEIPADVARWPMDDSPAEGRAAGGLRLSRYWSYAEVLERGARDQITDEATALAEVDRALGNAIRSQSIADVPVGAFLSGGIDSSSVVALYQKHSAVPIRTFTIGFDDSHFDEAGHARAVATHLGTIHNEHYVTAREAADVIPRLPTMFDEPFGDSSAVPTFLVSQFARDQVKVVMSGDGGDELFAGYHRHAEAQAVWNGIRRVPAGLRSAGAAVLRKTPFGVWKALDSLTGSSRRSPISGKVHKALAVGAAARTFDDVYSGYLDQWAADGAPVLNSGIGKASFPLDPGFATSNAVRMTYCDAVAYLPGDILCKVDRASMAASLECRVPFLDSDVADVAARIPMSMKLRGKTGKWIVRELLGQYLPRDLFERPKSGFAMPIGDWLRGDLREWAEDLLDPSRMRQEGFLDAARVQDRWRDILDKRRNASAAMWSLLMFQSWLRSDSPTVASTEVRAHAI